MCQEKRQAVMRASVKDDLGWAQRPGGGRSTKDDLKKVDDEGEGQARWRLTRGWKKYPCDGTNEKINEFSVS